jgi:phage anti-repressor protein
MPIPQFGDFIDVDNVDNVGNVDKFDVGKVDVMKHKCSIDMKREIDVMLINQRKESLQLSKKQ